MFFIDLVVYPLNSKNRTTLHKADSMIKFCVNKLFEYKISANEKNHEKLLYLNGLLLCKNCLKFA